MSAFTPEVLHHRYFRKITRHVRAVLGPDDEQDDLVHDVLIAVITGVGGLRDPERLDAWVARVTSNTLKSAIRRRYGRRHSSLEALPETEQPAACCEPTERDLASRALCVIGGLPHRDRTLLVAYWFTPLRLAAMAADAGCSVVTVRRRLARALARFQKLARRDPALAQRMADGGPFRRRRVVALARKNAERPPANDTAPKSQSSLPRRLGHERKPTAA